MTPDRSIVFVGIEKEPIRLLRDVESLFITFVYFIGLQLD